MGQAHLRLVFYPKLAFKIVRLFASFRARYMIAGGFPKFMNETQESDLWPGHRASLNVACS